jgi:oligopeptide/dipeptide ABC transporter ATP-binding protein
MLAVRNLSKHFPLRGGLFRRSKGAIKAVEDVSFDVLPGETLGLVGESGCGKSTLGRTLLRLEEPTSGSVLYQGRDLAAADRRELFNLRREVQMVFQDPYSSLNPRLTVGESVEEPLLIHRQGSRTERRARAAELFRRVGLSEEMLDRFPNEFSGGQRQRIGIARALALQPKLIVADEPVSALDVSVQAQVLNLMVDLQRQDNLTYVFISHDLSVVEYMSDRVAVMYLGRIVELGRRESIFRKPSHPYTQALIASSPVPDPNRRGEQKPIAGEIPSPLAPPPGCPFHPRCPIATDRCRAERPLLQPLAGTDHQVACHEAHR